MSVSLQRLLESYSDSFESQLNISFKIEQIILKMYIKYNIYVCNLWIGNIYILLPNDFCQYQSVSSDLYVYVKYIPSVTTKYLLFTLAKIFFGFYQIDYLVWHIHAYWTEFVC